MQKENKSNLMLTLEPEAFLLRFSLSRRKKQKNSSSRVMKRVTISQEKKGTKQD